MQRVAGGDRSETMIETGKQVQIAALMTCFNRKENTLASLRALYSQRLPENVSIDVYLVDAGSTDGTVSAVHEHFSEVQLIHANPTFFWNAGMRLAYETARYRKNDFYLWLNDDTELDDTALARLIAAHEDLRLRRGSPVIVAGCTRESATGRITYGGNVRRSGLRPLKFDSVSETSVPVRVDTMNGNCVLIPESIAFSVGNLDPSFVHSLGDFDYGLRAGGMGYEIWIVPGSIGTCESNSLSGTWEDRSLPIMQRWQRIRSPKGIPPHEWRVFAKRHGGPLWPIFWASPYVRLLLSAVYPISREEDK